VEEEIVYPAFKEHRSLKALVYEAGEEHQVAKLLLSDLVQLRPDDERYNAKVKVLSEYVLHHVKEEEKEMLPQAQKSLSAKRLEALGEEVVTRRRELMETGEERKEEGAKGGDEKGKRSV
jgi:hemerythrin-like domain-containing protein